jgi:hypothetical protein
MKGPQQRAVRNSKTLVKALLILSTVAGFGCAGYVPGRQAYWDAKVKEMCAKDGGVHILKKLHISKAESEHLPKVDGMLTIPIKEHADPKSPAFAVNRMTYVHQGNPSVRRFEWKIIRRSDQALLAQWVVYTRSGGDLLVVDMPSSYTCPDLRNFTSELQPLFVVEEDSK